MMDDKARSFETGRVRELREQRERIQKKTFTKWMNSFLAKANLEVHDLFTDLADGKMLIKLMEILSGEKLPKPNKGGLRVQKVENLNIALNFIQSKVIIENIGAEDILDGNQRLILGLVWTIILRFQIQEIVVADENESGEKKSAKDALLLWCQRKTRGYHNVNIKDFSGSWRDGLGFNALIHAHRPDLIDFDRLNPAERQKNLNLAFAVASSQLEVPRLLDAEDVDVERPDDKSIMTYVASMYHTFSKMKTETTGAKRVGKMLLTALEVAQLMEEYERLVRDLLAWIQRKIQQLRDRNFPNSVEGIQQEMHHFKGYRTEEKPPKYKDRSNIDAKLFQILLKQKENGLRKYIPAEGLLLKDVETAWNNLEKAEHERELTLRTELLRQERLSREAEKFMRKADLRESWLQDMTQILSTLAFGPGTRPVIESALKKLEAINADILAKKDRFEALSSIARYLVNQNYHASAAVEHRDSVIQAKWASLRAALGKLQAVSPTYTTLVALMLDVDSVLSQLALLEPQLHSTEQPKHLAAEEDLLARHAITEAQLNVVGDRLRKLVARVEEFQRSSAGPEAAAKPVRDQVGNLRATYDRLSLLSSERRAQLEAVRDLHRLLTVLEEEEVWLADKTQVMQNKDVGRDLQSVQRLIRKHELHEAEIEARWPAYQSLCTRAESLLRGGKTPTEVRAHMDRLPAAWSKLREATGQRRRLLEDALESQQYYADAIEAEQWMTERLPLVQSQEYGADEGSARALLKRHNALQREVEMFDKSDMQRLRELVTLMTKSSDKHNIQPEKLQRVTEDDEDEEDGEQVAVSSAPVWVEIPVQEIVEETIMEEVEREVEEPAGSTTEEIIQVHHAYAATDKKGRDLSIADKEVLTLLNKTNPDWWQARNAAGSIGYVPAKYVKLAGKRQVPLPPIKVVKKVKVPSKRQVRRTVMKRVLADSPEAKRAGVRPQHAAGTSKSTSGAASPTKKPKATLRRAPSARLQNNLHFDRMNVESRQKALNQQYDTLFALAKAREMHLSDMAKLYQFLRECQLFEDWMKEKEVILNQRDSLSQDVEGVRKRYEIVINDLALNAGRLTEIGNLAQSLLASGSGPEQQNIAKLMADLQDKFVIPMNKEQIRKRHQEIVDRWDGLNKLKCEKEKSLSGASSIELFNKISGELKEWIVEKIDALKNDDVGRDKASNEALKRRHQNLKLEMAPIEEKMNRMTYLGKEVKHTYPDEKGYVDNKTAEVTALYDKLRRQMSDRDKMLNSVGDQHKLHVDARDMGRELDNIAKRLADIQQGQPRDVQDAQERLQRHKDLNDELLSAEQKLANLCELGKSVLAQHPEDKKAAAILDQLTRQMADLRRSYDEGKKALAAALKAQQFYKECDQIDSLTSQQERMLDVDPVSDRVDDMERAMKGHRDMLAMIDKQEPRVVDLVQRATQLHKEGHPEDDKIARRCREVTQRREAMKGKAGRRWKDLEAALQFAQFKQGADELSEWIAEKGASAAHEGYKELANLPDKAKRHQALAAEISANKKALNELESHGEKIIKAAHPRAKDVRGILDDLKKRWEQLAAQTDTQGAHLAEAQQQSDLNQAMLEEMERLERLEKALASTELGDDLPSAKELLKKHQKLEEDLAAAKDRLNELKEKGRGLADAGHFDKAGITKALKALEDRSGKLSPLLAARKRQLQDSLVWQQFAFDVDQELHWIEDHRPAAIASDYGRSLAEATNLQTKHRKLLQEMSAHQASVQRVLDSGAALLKAKHPASADIETRSTQLRADWARLEAQAGQRRLRLELSVACQQLLNETNDACQWIGEKSEGIAQADRVKDLDVVGKMLAKIKTLEIDVATHRQLATKMAQEANRLTGDKDAQSLVPEAIDAVRRKVGELQDKLNDLDKLLDSRRRTLESQQAFLRYMEESEDLETWINMKLMTAASEDYGTDSEHLKILMGKWEEFMLSVDAATERFRTNDKQAAQLLAGANPRAEEILQQQQRVRADWDLLQEYIGARNDKFHSAAEIHRFNTEWSETMDRLEEKLISVPTDVGRDMNALQGYVKRHETFEAELVALEHQVHDLTAESDRLIREYPGGNAEAIQKLMADLNQAWDQLKQRTQERRVQLAAAHPYFKFCETIRLLSTWCEEAIREMEAEPLLAAHDVGAARQLVARGEELRAQFEERKPRFANVIQQSEAMIDDGHYAAEEIQGRADRLIDNQMRVGQLLKQWLTQLDQLLDQKMLYKELDQINELAAQQEAQIASRGLGSDVEEVEKLIKKQEATERLVAAYGDRLKAAQNASDQMINRGNYDKANIRARVDDCEGRHRRLTQACDDRHERLTKQLQWLQWDREAGELELWADERIAQMVVTAGSEHAPGGKQGKRKTHDLEEKMRILQRHQAFQAEVLANKTRFVNLVERADSMIKNGHPKSDQLKARSGKLQEKLAALLKQTDKQSRLLEEAKDLLTFFGEAETIELWLREKEMLVSANEMGDDLDHCLSLQEKLTEPVGGKQVDEARIAALCQLSGKLIKSGAEESKLVDKRQSGIRTQWDEVRNRLDSYRNRLAAAQELHRFNWDADDLMEQIRDRSRLANATELGKDVPSVDKLIRKQEALERDLSALQERLTRLNKEGDALVGKHPDTIDTEINKKKKLLESELAQLAEKTRTRRDHLTASQKFHKIKQETDAIVSWSAALATEFKTASPLKSVLGVQEARLHLAERSSDWRSRDTRAIRLKELATALPAPNLPLPTPETVGTLARDLTEAMGQAKVAIDERAKLLNDAAEFESYMEECRQTESWLSAMSSQATRMEKSPAPTSVSEVASRIRQLDAVEETVNSKVAKINGELANKLKLLSNAKNCGAEEAAKQHQNVLDHLASLRSQLSDQRHRLEDGLALQTFLRQAADQTVWIRSKMALAQEPTWLETSNLQRKMQKHLAFTSEVEASKPAVEAVAAEGRQLANAKPSHAPEITERVGELERRFEALLAACHTKTKQLQEAIDAVAWNRRADELMVWVEKREAEMAADDYGRDLATVRQLMKHLEEVESELDVHKSRSEELTVQAESMISAGHFQALDLSARSGQLQQQLALLPECIRARRNNLDESAAYLQFERDVQNELKWIKGKMPLATSQELGKSVAEVMQQQKRHAGLEAELTGHEHLIGTIGDAAHKMIENKHHAAGRVEQIWRELKDNLTKLKTAADRRTGQLSRAMELQTLLSGVSEAELWITERLPTVTGDDLGRDEDSAEALLKSLDTLKLDSDSEEATIQRLKEQADHFYPEHLTTVKSAVQKLSERFVEFVEILGMRRAKLTDNLKYFTYLRETEELSTWIRTQTRVAQEDGYGTDLEHCQAMSEVFADFMQRLTTNGSRVTVNTAQANKLIGEKNRYAPDIKEKSVEVNRLWAQLREQTKLRKEALAGALQVHAFDRDVGDLLDWIDVKESEVQTGASTLSTDGAPAPLNTTGALSHQLPEEFDHSLEATQELVQRHQTFQRDLVALQRQMDKLAREANRLKSLYPDAQAHIDDRWTDVGEAWQQLQNTSEEKKARLLEALDFQSWLERCREALAWMSNTTLSILGDDLAGDVPGAERLVQVNKNHKTEIDEHAPNITELKLSGQKLAAASHYLQPVMIERLADLDTKWNAMMETWEARRLLYEQSLDLRRLFSEMVGLEKWVGERQSVLSGCPMPESPQDAVDALKRHDEFTKGVLAVEPRFEAIKRPTLVEQARDRETRRKQQEEDRGSAVLGEERLAEIKRQATQRLVEGKRLEDDKKQRETVPQARPRIVKRQKSADVLQIERPPPVDTHVKVSVAPNLSTSPEIRELDHPLDEAVSPSSPSSPSKVGPSGRRVKKTASFSTKKKPTSFRQESGGSIQIQGRLERKHVFLTNRRKATVRHWKSFYATLSGHLLTFYKDGHDMSSTTGGPGGAAAGSSTGALNIHSAVCEMAVDYVKKEHVLRLRLEDQTEFLLGAPSHDNAIAWLVKLQTNAQLSPSDQYSGTAPHAGEGAPARSTLQRVDLRLSEDLDAEVTGMATPMSPPTTPASFRQERDGTEKMGVTAAGGASPSQSSAPRMHRRPQHPDSDHDQPPPSGKLKSSDHPTASVRVSTTLDRPKSVMTPMEKHDSHSHHEPAAAEVSVRSSVTLPHGFQPPTDPHDSEKVKKRASGSKGLSKLMPGFMKKKDKSDQH